jgi:hypothetical protein
MNLFFTVRLLISGYVTFYFDAVSAFTLLVAVGVSNWVDSKKHQSKDARRKASKQRREKKSIKAKTREKNQNTREETSSKKRREKKTPRQNQTQSSKQRREKKSRRKDERRKHHDAFETPGSIPSKTSDRNFIRETRNLEKIERALPEIRHLLRIKSTCYELRAPVTN